MTNKGIEKAEHLFGITGLLTTRGQDLYRHLLLALRVTYLFKLNHDYVVENGEIVLLDNINGRKIGGTKLQAGLHQALEAKEKIPITNESRAIASITYQNLFRKFKKLAGMTGTGMSDRQEFLDTYGLNVVAIPTNKPVQRIDKRDLVFADNQTKILASIEEVKAAYAIGRPVLIATGSVTMSNLYSRILLNGQISHSVLNASRVARESAIIAQAGTYGAITVTINFKGTSIKKSVRIGRKYRSKLC
ncbi:preprotein translocase subunit SecA [Periweissella beninensis]|uniref:SecA family profile domain-containing protein n=1 Tax=Periweissella beninensis TaxID=504936 RepID=A0ABT0VHZ6_9LACO|nr:hypothetical protein [Periweissella beninensis]MBM7544169.1 preprotein translocase subunit SecA [Periweissella beninensis]MCM2437458.1 hypothetical protein [Periweissella beninensis]MCT4396684.1 hypothetical protein [Periweissella beninensis]